MGIISSIKLCVSLRITKKKYEEQANEITKLIIDEDFEVISQKKVNSPKSITFIIPNMVRYSGGRTSILRLGTSLFKQGYDVRYIPYIAQKIDEMKEIAENNLPLYKGIFLPNDQLESLSSDIIVATNWQSVYYAKKCIGYKMYFIQDYEPYFHLYGELFLLAKKTYELGFHMVSLGAWNKYKIEKECNVKFMDVIDFPYENKEYSYLKRDYSNFTNKKSYKIAIYIKRDGKRLPIMIQIMLQKVKELFSIDGINIELLFFGLDKSEKLTVGNNLGKLKQKELEVLYHKCDFGMVASMSNISLVPYEMISTGLPVIEFEEGTFKYFFKEESSILTSFSYKTLYKKMKYYIDNPDELIKINGNALQQLSILSWEKTGKQFGEIIQRISN